MILLLTVSCVSIAHASLELEVGNSAPPLKVEKWLRGSPVDGFAPGKIYVVEFWGTWCLPCLAEISHLNALAKKYGQHVTVIGVASSERGSPEEKLTAVNRFLAKGQPAIEYHVAFDSTETMNDAWLRASEAQGIPSAFVVDRRGKIAFTGHPSLLDQEGLGNPLRQIVEGTWLESRDSAEHMRQQLSEKESVQKYHELIGVYLEAQGKENWAAASEVAILGEKLPAPYGDVFHNLRIDLMISHLGQVANGLSLLRKSVDSNWEDVQALGNILALLIHENVPAMMRDLPLGKRLADRVLDLIDKHPDANVRAKYQMYRWVFQPSVARYYFVAGDYSRAVDLQTAVLASLPAGRKELAAMKEDLNFYKAAFKKDRAKKALPIDCPGGICALQKASTPLSTSKCAALFGH